MGFTASCVVTSLQSWHCGIRSRCCRRWLLKTRRDKGSQGFRQRGTTLRVGSSFSHTQGHLISWWGRLAPKASEDGRGFVSGHCSGLSNHPAWAARHSLTQWTRICACRAPHACASVPVLWPAVPPAPTHKCPFLQNPPRSPGAKESLLLTPATGNPLLPSLFYSCRPSLGRLCIPAPLVSAGMRV